LQCPLIGSPIVLVVHPSLGVKSYAELAALASKGKTELDYVSPGFGTVGNVVAEYLASRAKIDLRHVPYKGGGTAIIDLVASDPPVCLRHPHDGADDAVVAATATQIAGERAANLGFGRLRIALEQVGRRDDHAAGANSRTARPARR
jgi:hypothetical protein